MAELINTVDPVEQDNSSAVLPARTTVARQRHTAARWKLNWANSERAMVGSDSQRGRLLRAMSLESLRGFESVARHLSFTAAAEELCLTQSAVSKQVKALEESIGRLVFLRGSGSISLTTEGSLLYHGVRTMLGQMENLLERIVRPPRAAVSVSVTPSFASLWLAPRLQRFRDAEPLVDLRVDGSEVQAALDKEGFDVGIRLSDTAPTRGQWTALARERIMIVAAPRLARGIRELSDLRSVALLNFHDPLNRFPWMSWTNWLARRGMVQHREQPVLHFSQYEHLVKAATEGVGVALGRTPLVLPLLHGKALENVLPDEIEDGLAYHIGMSERARQREEVLRFCAWVSAEMAARPEG